MSSLKDKPLKKCHTDNRKMIDELHSNIVKDKTKEELNEYYQENGLLLDKYYNFGNIKSSIDTEDKVGILSYFNIEKKEDKEDKEDKEEKSNTNKREIINEYMCNINDTILDIRYKDYDYYKCQDCNHNMDLDPIKGLITCSKCGGTKDVIIMSDKNSYNDPPKEANYFAYKRINHFNEWLAQFQAKETTEIPEKIYSDIYKELKKDINLNIQKLNYKQVRDVLKKLKYNKYYDHIPHLINIITGEKAPQLTINVEEKLRALFKEIQIPFHKYCPPSRKNFLSYSYVLHKFCELLEYDNLLPFFPLLKSREKLQQQDQIWKEICKDLKWQYIPSA
jgi:DNA-directed RNA polymerase subunit RPC12/RpoP